MALALGRLRGSRTAALVAGTVAVLAATALMVVPGAGSTSVAAASTTPPNCQGATPLGVSGNWTCTFDDEFNGTSLNTSLWAPELTAANGYVAGLDCYVNNSSVISESGGYLNLSAIKVPSGTPCVGAYKPIYQTGMVTTRAKWTQTYGDFEVRAKIPAATVKGLQEAFWLYPENLTYGKWPASGEVDFGQTYSEYPTLDIPNVVYTESKSDPNATSYKCTIDPTQFNVYEVDWTPTTMTILYNGNVCLTDSWLPTQGDPTGAPFNQPFMIALTQAIGSTTNMPTSSTPFPDTTQVDWVRAWSAAS